MFLLHYYFIGTVKIQLIVTIKTGTMTVDWKFSNKVYILQCILNTTNTKQNNMSYCFVSSRLELFEQQCSIFYRRKRGKRDFERIVFFTMVNNRVN